MTSNDQKDMQKTEFEKKYISLLRSIFAWNTLFRIFFSSLMILFTFISGVILFLVYQNRDLIKTISTSGHTFTTSIEVLARIETPVKIFAPLEKNIKLPFKQNLHVNVPIKTTLSVPIINTFDVPIEKPISISIDHKFPVNEVVAIDVMAPIDSDVDAKLFGIEKNIKIHGELPIKLDVPISHEFRLNDTFKLSVIDTISMPINHIFDIPVEIDIDATIPVDVTLDIPVKIDLESEIFIKDEIPVILDLEINFNLLKGITIKGIKFNQ